MLTDLSLPLRLVPLRWSLVRLFCLSCMLLCAAAAGAVDDVFLAGYATATIERDLGLEVVSVEVREGVARIVLKDLGGVSPDRVAEALARVEGIERVEVRVAGEEADEEPVAETQAEPESEPSGVEVLPRHEIFDPLLADPRQPHFSLSYLWYLDEPGLTHVGSANVGETFALLGGELGDGPARWELGLLGGVFSIFDLDAPSYDLINSDFWFAPTLSLRSDRLSGQLRVYHQSSHLGDEFQLRTPQRLNLSYEGVDLLLSAHLHPALRIYAGGGRIIYERHIHPLSGQAGVELQSPIAFFGVVRPLVAGDFQFREENHWREQIGAIGGIQLENPEISRLRLLIVCEYFRGNSPNGQFFERRIEYLGVGAHLHF